MRSFRIGVYVLSILALQSVVFARLNFWGTTPDLILVSVVIFALLQDLRKTIPIAFGAAVLQDTLAFGTFINTFSKVVVSLMVNFLKEYFLSNAYFLAVGFVAFFTPISLLLEGWILSFFFGKEIIIFHLLKTIFLSTLYNLIMIPVLYPIIEKLCHE